MKACQITKIIFGVQISIGRMGLKVAKVLGIQTGGIEVLIANGRMNTVSNVFYSLNRLIGSVGGIDHRIPECAVKSFRS